MTGAFVAVVGPSGAGKDTLIRCARDRFGPTGRFCFPARVITRAAGDSSEDHVAVTERQFAAIRDDGGFALSWRAHGLSYGIPIEVVQRIGEGRNVVANLSRTAIDEARRTFPSLRVIVVSAPETVIAARIAGRGRETTREIAGRLTRSHLVIPTGGDVDVVDNGGELAAAADRFIALLERHGA